MKASLSRLLYVITSNLITFLIVKAPQGAFFICRFSCYCFVLLLLCKIRENKKRFLLAKNDDKPVSPVDDELDTEATQIVAPVDDDATQIAEVSTEVFDAVALANASTAQTPVLDIDALFGVNGPAEGKIFELSRSCTIGRSPLNDIIVKEDSVSSFHAEFEKQEKRWVVRDLGSSNGTYVNEHFVEDERVLRNRDTLRLGSIEFLFNPDEDPFPDYEEEFTSSDVKTEAKKEAKPEVSSKNKITIWIAIGVGVLVTIGAIIALV